MTDKDIQQSSLPDGVEDAAGMALETFSFLTRWNTEILSLYGKRMQGYCLLPLSLAFCTSKDDFDDLQDNFQAALQADYREAAANLAAAVTKAGKAAEAESYASIVLAAQEDARAIIEQAKGQARLIVEKAEKRARAPVEDSRESAAA